ncbi:hypothetical protein ACN6AT_02990 [Streptomyces sp. JL4002]|uniref:hypothetical protein n=1 Tax=Streptomyces TaxID=1883 RepID=UPI003B27E3CB
MWEPAADGGGSVCVDCGTATRTYQYRVYPPGSPHHARCIGLAWCSDCRVYSGTMVHVPPERVLDDALAALPQDRRERTLRSETRLIQYLDKAYRPGTLPGS